MVHLDVEVNHQYIKHAVYLKSLALSNTIFIGARTYKVIYNIITAVYPENEPPPTPPLCLASEIGSDELRPFVYQKP